MGECSAKIRSYYQWKSRDAEPSTVAKRLCGGVYMSRQDGQNNLTVSMA
jgi:hypothetical protein